MEFRFNMRYFIVFILILIIEVSIALFITTGFIRHTFGDVLAVILIFSFIKSVLNAKSIYVALSCLALAFFIEILQKFKILNHLNLDDSTLIKTIVGTTFEVSDLLAYITGFLIIIAFEYQKKVT